MPASAQLGQAFGGAGGGLAQQGLMQGGAGMGMSAMSSYESGQYQAQVARNNQQIANQNADLALFKGNQMADISQQRTAQTIGQQRAGAGASGVDVNTGSPLRDQMDTARIGAMDVGTIRANAQRAAWGQNVAAENFANEGKLDEAKGDFGAIGSLIGNGQTFANKWQQYQTSTNG